MSVTAAPPTLPTAPASCWQRTAAAFVRGFHAYANWLVGISWLRFFLLAVLLLIVAGILSEIPPFNLTLSERVVERPRKVVVETKPKADTPVPPVPPTPPKSAEREPLIKIERPKGSGATESVEISIGEKGIRITPRAAEPAQVASDAADEARRDAEEAPRDADAPEVRVVKVRAGDVLPDLALVWIFSSMILKIAYKGGVQAEVKAAQATEMAEAESLKRQVVEARLAAMQAQVEPHFLFNTLASIDHLIETDPPRASQMQKHLIALLRATMPTMRETQAASLRELGREMAVIRPYLELLKMRMEERLQVEIAVPAGLLTAEFPPMMLQTLVENAIKHGLEPKPEGGVLRVAAEVVDGRLEVEVADTGVGFGAAGTAGTGVGLENVRERLALLYGARAALTVAANPGGGTVATIAVPYVARAKEAA